MLRPSVWARLVGAQGAVVEGVELEDDPGGGGVVLVVSVRVPRRGRRRCGVCRRRCPGYDRGAGRRRWRALDLGTVPAVIEADAPRVACPTHGVVVAAVPWARHSAGHTRDFDDTVAWMAVAASKSAVCELLRIAWRTVGAIITRVEADFTARTDRLAGLRRIGIDEVSYKKGHKYLTVVVDHDTGRLVWAAPGRNKQTVHAFFDALGAQRAGQLTHISADAAEWIGVVVADRAPAAVRCADSFHVVAWATEALDEVFPQLRIIFVRRRDKVRQAVSLWKALQTQQWRRDSDEDVGEQGLRFNFAAVNHLKLRIDEHNAAWQDFFDGCGVEPLTVVYEDLVEDYEGTVLWLLDGIGIPVPENFAVEKPRMKRQADELSEEWVRLHDERAAARTAGKG